MVYDIKSLRRVNKYTKRIGRVLHRIGDVENKFSNGICCRMLFAEAVLAC